MTQPYGQDPRYAQDPRYGQDPRYAQDPQYGADAQYGREPQHGPPGDRYSAVANAYGDPVGSGASFGVVGATLAGIGAVLLVIALTALKWSAALPAAKTFGDVHDALARNPGAAAGLADSYFGWLAWTLTVLVVAIAIAANLPSPASGPLRALGAVLAAAAIAVTFFAIDLYVNNRAYTEYLKDARLGFYFAIAGFVIAGIGALIGPTRRR